MAGNEISLGDSVRDALFLAPSRTYAEQFIEPVIRSWFDLEDPKDSDHDAVGPDGTLYEIKASKVQKLVDTSSLNLLERVLAQNGQASRAVLFSEATEANYLANMQNVKRDHFDELIYVLLFHDCVKIFSAKRGDIKTGVMPSWSDKHGRYDQLGKSGQFPINKGNIEFHLRNHLKETLSYDQVAGILTELSEE